MTTVKDKPLKRLTHTSSHEGRLLIVEIHSNDVLVLREKGRRKGYKVHVKLVFALGARLEADENRKIKAAKRKKKQC